MNCQFFRLVSVNGGVRCLRVGLDLASLNLLQGGREFGPILHDDNGAGIAQHLLHFGFLVVSVRTNVADDLDSSAGAAEGAALAVLDGNRLLSSLAKILEGVKVDGWVGLAGGLGETGGGGVDEVLAVGSLEVLVLANLVDGRLDTTESRRRDNGHQVLLGSSELLELGINANAGAQGGLELGDNSILLASNI